MSCVSFLPKTFPTKPWLLNHRTTAMFYFCYSSTTLFKMTRQIKHFPRLFFTKRCTRPSRVAAWKRTSALTLRLWTIERMKVRLYVWSVCLSLKPKSECTAVCPAPSSLRNSRYVCAWRSKPAWSSLMSGTLWKLSDDDSGILALCSIHTFFFSLRHCRLKLQQDYIFVCSLKAWVSNVWLKKSCLLPKAVFRITPDNLWRVFFLFFKWHHLACYCDPKPWLRTGMCLSVSSQRHLWCCVFCV